MTITPDGCDVADGVLELREGLHPEHQQHQPARDQPRLRGAVVIEVRIGLRDDRGFTLTELLVVMSLLGMVLTVAYAALQLTFQSGDIQRRNAFVSTSITEPLQLMDVVISQNLSIDSGSGDYLLSVLTDQNADNAKERHVYQATNDGRLVETVYNVGANDANTSVNRSTVWQKVIADLRLAQHQHPEEQAALHVLQDRRRRSAHALDARRCDPGRRARRGALRQPGLLRPTPGLLQKPVVNESGAGPMMRDIRSLARDDQGIAMVVVMGAIALITIFAMGGYAMASQAMHSTGRLQNEEAAFQVANSGMERELATFNESNFTSGQTTYQRAGSTPDGTYVVQVGFDPAVPYRYSLISSATASGEGAMVRQDFYFFDLWSTNISSKNNPDMGPMGSASAWNGNSTISGPFYVGGDLDVNSNVVFVGGPLFVQGNAIVKAGTDFVPVPSGSKYPMFVRGSQSGIPSNVKVYSSCPKLELPWTDPDYNDRMLAKARAESSDNLRGTDHGDGSTPTNGEVSTTGMPTTYTGTKAQNATNYYKEIDGNLTITGASASFGKVTKTAGVATNWDDFAFDTDDNTLYVDGVVFVDGDVTIGCGRGRTTRAAASSSRPATC